MVPFNTDKLMVKWWGKSFVGGLTAAKFLFSQYSEKSEFADCQPLICTFCARAQSSTKQSCHLALRPKWQDKGKIHTL
jgi:hypothetical protein